jgi:hypothetical protein
VNVPMEGFPFLYCSLPASSVWIIGQNIIIIVVILELGATFSVASRGKSIDLTIGLQRW